MSFRTGTLPFEEILEVEHFSPTSSTVLTEDPDALYITEQFSGVVRLDLKDRSVEQILDLRSDMQEMRDQAKKRGWKKTGFRHWTQKDFEGGLADERGVMGFAFHPQFQHNGKIYVYYAEASDQESIDHYNILSEFIIHDDQVLEERELLRIPFTVFNHNGGNILFGPDGYLYIGIGDGGGRDDVHGKMVTKGVEASLVEKGEGAKAYLGNAQDPTTLQGKILRIDVDRREKKLPYAIPPDNPFVDQTVRDFPSQLSQFFSGKTLRKEIYAYGLRNPWKFSFDSRGRLFAADVGQDLVEEVDLIVNGGNYGWRVYEGDRIFHHPLKEFLDNVGITESFLAPILTHGRDKSKRVSGNAVIGGYIYEGSHVPELQGYYVYADYVNNKGEGLVLVGDVDTGKPSQPSVLAKLPGETIHSLGQDIDGELYVFSLDKDKKMHVRKITGGSDQSFSPSFKMSGEPIRSEGMLFEPLFAGEPGLSAEEAADIIDATEKYIYEEAVSGLRRKGASAVAPRMHIAVLSRDGMVYTSSMTDAWRLSFDIAIRKANTALGFSSNENALTSRSIGALSQPGGALWQIGSALPGELVEFPGGIPLYKNGFLVGAIGVSGDAVDVDEAVARAGAKGYEAPRSIRMDVVTDNKVSYTK